MQDESIAISKIGFDPSAEIPVAFVSAGETKKVLVKFPTDEQWLERSRRRKLVTKNLGNGKSSSDVPDSEEIDAELFAQIRISKNGDAAIQVDPFEAALVIDRLEQADLENIEREGNNFRVTLRIPGGTSVHILRMPSIREAAQYSKNIATYVSARFGRTEMTVNQQVAADLYDKLKQSVEGYSGDAVPVIHKTVVTGAVVQETRGLSEGSGANF